MKEQNWYFRDWQYENVLENGKQTRKLVYKGEYYKLRLEEKYRGWLKGIYVALTLLMWAVLLLMLAVRTRASTFIAVGLPTAIALIPLMFITIGAFALLPVPEEMTSRDVRATLTRMVRGSEINLFLFGIAIAGDLFYWIYRSANGLPIELPLELVWLLGPMVCFAATLAVNRLNAAHPAEQIPRELLKDHKK